MSTWAFLELFGASMSYSLSHENIGLNWDVIMMLGLVMSQMAICEVW